MARQNSPVLWLTESACSRPEQPLSATHGRQRYNTLDFAPTPCSRLHGVGAKSCATKPLVSLDSSCQGGRCPPLDSSRQDSSAAFGNHCQGNTVPFGFPCQQDAPRPYWMTPGQRNCRPFGIPARFEMSTHKGKWFVVTHFKTTERRNPKASSGEKMKLRGF